MKWKDLLTRIKKEIIIINIYEENNEEHCE